MTDTLDRIVAKRDTLSQLRLQHVTAWQTDPVKWVDDLVRFDEGDGLADYQAHELALLATDRRVAVRGPRGSGKTMPAALAFWWFACTSELMGVDWKVVSTAGSWDQIKKYLWPEIHKWHRRINWDLMGLPKPRIGIELMKFSLSLPNGEGFGRATDDPDLIEGAHATRILVIVDEGKSVPDDIWDAIEGFFSNPGDHYVFALSTPGAAIGRFHDICTRQSGYEDWTPIHVTIQEAIRAGRITESWRADRERQWGTSSMPYRCHVLAEFAGDPDGVIPMAWIEAAMERSRNPDLEGACAHDRHIPQVVAGDIADTGEDNTVIAARCDWCLFSIEKFTDGDVVQQADRMMNRAQRGTRLVVDSIGVGAGTLATVKRTYTDAEGFVASAGTKRKDRSGTFGFTNLRAAAWWNLRELLDPQLGEPVVLPDVPELLGDLSAPKYREMAGGKLQVESKDDIRKRLGRSTDMGDTVVMAFWDDVKKRRRLGEGTLSDSGLRKS